MNAVVTAGAPIDGEYARAAGTTLKALAPIRGRTMIGRTLDVLREVGIAHIAVVGNEEIRRAVGGKIEKLIPDTGSGSGNVLAALDAWRGENDALLYLTCDMPFITATALQAFLAEVPPDALAMPLTEIDDFRKRFPDAPPFGITLANETVINGGAFVIPAGGSTRISGFATSLFEARKAPWKMASIAGPALLLKFALKRLSIAEVEARAQRVLAMNVRAVRHAAPELAYDADTADEYRYAIDHD